MSLSLRSGDGNSSAECFEEHHLEELVSDDFGGVRERRDNYQTSLKPILPSPHREFTFTGLTGWRYYPPGHSSDRLGTSRAFSQVPETKMVIPSSWKTHQIDTAKSQLEQRVQESNAQMLSDIDRETKWQQRHKRQRTHDDEDVIMLLLSSSSVSLPTPKDVMELAASTVKTRQSASTTTTTMATTNKSVAGTTMTASSTVDTDDKPMLDHSDTRMVGTITPNITMELPKDRLYTWYAKKPRRVQLPKSSFICWDNGFATEKQRFSAAFCCPVTKEVFLAGRYGDHFERDGTIVWYTKKSLAVHAVSARAMDCWALRMHSSDRMGFEPPYLTPQEAPVFPSHELPPRALEQVEDAKKRPPLQPTPPMPDGTQPPPPPPPPPSTRQPPRRRDPPWQRGGRRRWDSPRGRGRGRDGYRHQGHWGREGGNYYDSRMEGSDYEGYGVAALDHATPTSNYQPYINTGHQEHMQHETSYAQALSLSGYYDRGDYGGNSQQQGQHGGRHSDPTQQSRRSSSTRGYHTEW